MDFSQVPWWESVALITASAVRKLPCRLWDTAVSLQWTGFRLVELG
jgi:hypothetical protein